MTHKLTLHISEEMAEAIAIVTKAEDATPGEIIRDAIRRDLRRRVTVQKTAFESRRSLDPLRKLLQPEFEKAQSWYNLQGRLIEKGYKLLQGQGDLMVHRASGERICRLGDLGQNQITLARRFDAAFVAKMTGPTDEAEALAS